MIVQVKRFDFVKGVVTLHPRIVPDKLPETPLTALLRRQAKK